MTSFSLSYHSSTIRYQVYPGGPALFFCFHGFGESSGSFAVLERNLKPVFTLVAIDLPFHGNTEWNEGLAFEPAGLVEVLQLITARLSMEFTDISLLGFSMGARVALGLFELIPEKIRQLVLLAPDGISANFWYLAATQRAMGRANFFYTMQHPGWFNLVLNLALKTGIANAGEYKFATSYLQEENVRMDLYRRWITMRAFEPDLRRVKTEISKRKIPVVLVYGEYDQIIRPEQGKKFQKEIEPFCRVVILACGHQVLQEKNAGAITQLLKS